MITWDYHGITFRGGVDEALDFATRAAQQPAPVSPLIEREITDAMIIEFIKGSDAAVTTRDIARQFGIPRPYVIPRIKALVDAGKLHRVGHQIIGTGKEKRKHNTYRVTAEPIVAPSLGTQMAEVKRRVDSDPLAWLPYTPTTTRDIAQTLGVGEEAIRRRLMPLLKAGVALRGPDVRVEYARTTKLGNQDKRGSAMYTYHRKLPE